MRTTTHCVSSKERDRYLTFSAVASALGILRKYLAKEHRDAGQTLDGDYGALGRSEGEVIWQGAPQYCLT